MFTAFTDQCHPGPAMGAIVDANIFFPYARTLAFSENLIGSALSRLGVTYVVVHTELDPPGEWPRVQSRINQFADRLWLMQIVGSGRLYVLR